MDLLAAVALILALGVASRILADRLQIPSVLFLIVAGVVIGPEVLGLVSFETFEGGLSAMVGVAVAIILFEGGYHLELSKLRETPTATFKLVTVGALITWLGTALAVTLFLDVGYETGLLIGALLIATGPTVIGPILQVVPVRNHVGSILESEGIINDITAAILAVVIYEVLVHPDGAGSLWLLVPEFLLRLIVGLGIGVAIAASVWYLLKNVSLVPDAAPLHARLIVLAAIIVAYGGAETILAETGIAAAAAAGFVLGNVDLPHHEEVIDFLDDLSVVVLSFIFVALAALINVDDIIELGLPALGIVIAVVFILRPLVIAISATGERFTSNEKLFLSAVGPRGIIPAAVATLFAVELETVGQFDTAGALAGTVFLIISVTVVLQGGLARNIAERLNVIPMHTIIVGAGRVGTALAERLERDGENVIMLEKDPEAAEKARDRGLRVIEGDGTDADDLQKAEIDNAKTFVAATPSDDVNLLACQLAKTRFDMTKVASRVNQPGNVEAFESMGVRTMDVSMATAWSLENVLERPALSQWMNELGRTGDVQEIAVTSEELIGKPISEINKRVPEGCIVGLVTDKEGNSHVPTGDQTIERGDHITFIGETEAVDKAVKRFHPHE